MTVSITIDRKWGGFYFHGITPGDHVSARLCIGYLALDFFPRSVEQIFMVCLDEIDRLKLLLSSPAAGSLTDSMLSQPPEETK